MRAFMFAAVLSLAASAAVAQSAATSLTLADAARAPARATILDGATWTCDDTGACTATGGRNQPAERACRRVVARLGAVSAFSWKGEDLTAEQLTACNAVAG